MGPGAGIGLLQGPGALEDEDALGLIVVGGGGVPSRLQDEIQLFLLHRPGGKFAQGVPRGGKGLEVHSRYLFLTFKIRYLKCSIFFFQMQSVPQAK